MADILIKLQIRFIINIHVYYYVISLIVVSSTSEIHLTFKN